MHCIIPPHMMDSISVNGDAAQRKWATSALREDEDLRVARNALHVDATPDAVAAPLAAAPPATPGLYREVFDGGSRATLPGNLVRREGDPPTGDDAVDEAYDGAGCTYNLYNDEYNRNSLDGAGMALVSTVHHRRQYNNAFWNGQQMAYGDGDGQIFTRFTQSLAVVGHELSHGMVHHEGGLVYSHQSGALNEHVADVFGMLVDQREQGQEAHESDWLIGREILGPNINGDALRTMRAPGTAYSDPVLGQDIQPYHMRGLVRTQQDNGGVHINSGIPNHAFYLVAQYFGGRAWEAPGQIWYQALVALNNRFAQFTEFADLTVQTARKIHGAGSAEEGYVRRAWRLVDVL